MDEAVRARIAGFRGEVSLFAKNLDSGKTYGIRPDEPVRTASTIKLPILVAVAAAVEAGETRWDDLLELREQDKVSGSGVLREFIAGTKIRLRDAANLMIVVSDNTATNLILARIGGDRVNQEMEKLGLVGTRSIRKIRGDGNQLKEAAGWSKFGERQENQRYGIGVSTPREMVTLLEKLERGEAVSQAASREILATLKRQQYKDGIGRRVEPGTVVASKSGALDALRSDVGIVYSKSGRVVIAITVDGMPKVDYSADNVGNVLIAELTGLILQGLKR